MWASGWAQAGSGPIWRLFNTKTLQVTSFTWSKIVWKGLSVIRQLKNLLSNFQVYLCVIVLVFQSFGGRKLLLIPNTSYIFVFRKYSILNTSCFESQIKPIFAENWNWNPNYAGRISGDRPIDQERSNLPHSTFYLNINLLAQN